MIQALAACLLALGFVVCAGAAGAHDPVTTKVTFGREIRAILSARCVVCHAARGSAPMPLTTYEETRPWARAIKEQILTRKMPKWHAARGVGAFVNDSTLTPFEISLFVSWVDGGLPRGADAATPVTAERGRGGFATPPDEAIRIAIPPGGDLGRGALASPRWVTGWRFDPGDALITAAVISLDGVSIGAWVAGDRPTVLPAGMAFKAVRRIRVDVRRRRATDYEQSAAPRPSLLVLATQEAAPARRVWTEQVGCGAARTGPPADMLAIRPLLDRSSARLWVDRPGAPATMVGWFREFDPLYPRTYWLLRAADLAADARLRGDVPCRVELTLAARY